MKHQPMSLIRLASTLTLSLALPLASPAKADETCNLDIRANFRTLVGGQSATREWIAFHQLDQTTSASRTVAKDEPVFAAKFQRFRESNAMEAPTDFRFRSGWILNSQFEFRQGERLPVKAVYNLPSGETYYALQPRAEPHLTIFAKPDGTLCNKVMNTNAGDHVFLIKEYKSTPSTRLVMSNARVDGRAPVVLKIIYLGATGGIASFRALWSRDGRILQHEDLQYDQGATRISIAGLELPVSELTTGSVTVGEVPLTDRIAWNSYWSRWFND
ncbi:MAG: hypothetical protein FH747_09690 [Stenotrophomonas sp.]|uniref:hypothetical protein n=1 Tax=Stenotrophomonas sp. TaxID=69392 RepID=UPI0013560905|nr:hypothetical protein [Stenotrophomonas sp.]MTI73912.1 hypothetical protein [Stenotrophomonas sp.]